MPYNQNIPQATDQQDVSQGQILQNFQAINTLVNANHYTFGSGATLEGKHKFVSMPQQAAAPTFLTNENGLFSLIDAFTAQRESYINKRNFSGSVNIPFTSSILSTINPTPGTNGWTYLPSGIILKWDGITAFALGSNTFNYPALGPAFTTVLAVFLTPFSASVGDVNFAVRLVNVGATNFTVYFSNRTTAGGTATGGAKVLFIGM